MTSIFQVSGQIVFKFIISFIQTAIHIAFHFSYSSKFQLEGFLTKFKYISSLAINVIILFQSCSSTSFVMYSAHS
ncbi:MAG: hypothetical protein Q8S84_03945 [bacterium]|nr:hypothetical protein [bacterium]MDP3380663.1 hypothetical protein [bacterium]